MATPVFLRSRHLRCMPGRTAACARDPTTCARDPALTQRRWTCNLKVIYDLIAVAHPNLVTLSFPASRWEEST